MCHKENDSAKDGKENMVKEKAYYLRMAQEVDEKEKDKAFLTLFRRDHKVWSSRDEDEETTT